MIRAFLKLYLLVIIPLLVIAFIPGTPLRWLIDDMAQNILAEQYKGTFFLFEKELENLPQSEWPEHIRKLNKEFARELKLEKIANIDIRDSQRRKLLDDGLLHSSEDTAGYWYRIRDSQYAIYNELEDSDEELFKRDAQGTVFLVRKWINNYDDPRLGLKALRKEFGFPLKILHENELELSEAKKEALRKDQIVAVELNGSEVLYYVALGTNDLIIKAGPISDHNLEQRAMAMWASFPALLLAIAILLWSIPFWRDLLRVKKSAFALGEGDFESRVKLPKGSALFDLGNSFNAMAKQIKQLIDGQKELTNAVSHELKTPVARLRFAHEMLQEQPHQADQKRYLANIDRDLGELESLIDELLTHARYDRADYPIYPDNHALKSWLDLLLLEFSDLYPKLSFSLSIDSAIETAWIDKRAMSRAIRNLLSNAVRYARSKVQISVTHDLESLDFHVDDDGHGISEADRLKVFEPFVRLDSSRQRGSGGTGLGLAIVKRIVGRHGGSVLCEKSDLGGARFTLSLTTLDKHK